MKNIDNDDLDQLLETAQSLWQIAYAADTENSPLNGDFRKAFHHYAISEIQAFLRDLTLLNAVNSGRNIWMKHQKKDDAAYLPLFLNSCLNDLKLAPNWEKRLDKAVCEISKQMTTSRFLESFKIGPGRTKEGLLEELKQKLQDSDLSIAASTFWIVACTLENQHIACIGTSELAVVDKLCCCIENAFGAQYLRDLQDDVILDIEQYNGEDLLK